MIENPEDLNLDTSASAPGDDASADGSTADATTQDFSAQDLALAACVLDIERNAAALGWDRPPSLYALVRTQDLLHTPDMPPEMITVVRENWDGHPEHLSAILQEDLKEDDLEQVLGRLAWPEGVDGAALSVERMIVPPEVEEQAPEDPDEAIAFIMEHPARTDVRLVAGALRSGETWTAVRTRTFDSDDQVGSAPNLVPALVEALQVSLEHDLGDARA